MNHLPVEWIMAFTCALCMSGCVAHKTTTIYPTYKGSAVRDPGSTGHVVRDGVIYPAYKKSQVPDRTKTGGVIRRN